MKLAILVLAISTLSLGGCRASKAQLDARLIDAIMRRDVSGAKDALAAGADPNAVDPEEGMTALAEATQLPELMPILIKAGATLDKPDPNGNSPIFAAVSHPDSTSLKLLLHAGAQVDGRDEQGYTPLLRAATYGRLENAELLIKAGADLNAANNDGMTPLVGAVTSMPMGAASPEPMVRLLLKQGADPTLKTFLGRSALDWANDPRLRAVPGNSEVAALLRRATADKRRVAIGAPRR